jgi:hypothetical protein
MDILNFISWIRGGRKFTTVDPFQTLLPAAIKDPKRDDQWLTGTISVDDFAAQVGPYAPAGPQGPIGPQGVPGPVGPAGLVWQGLWSASLGYSENDAVSFGGASYFCYNPAGVGPSAINPATDTANWALLAAEGATGPQGPQGPAGGTSKVFSSTAIGTTVTGTTAPTISQSFLVPANTLITSGVLQITWGVQRTTAVSGLNTRVYVNTTNSLSGATLIATGGNLLIPATGINSYYQSIRTIQKINNTAYIFSNTFPTASEYGGFNAARTTFTLDNSNNLYIIFAVVLTNTSDSAAISGVLLQQF